jgi:predicted nuclease of predicted toxin-antitoxin system
VKLLVDINLSPSWIERLARHGFEAVHWSTIGAATAPDVEILTFANEHHFVVITNDLDFSALLAAGVLDGPSVVQIRSQDLLSDVVVSIVAKALDGHREDIERGALLSIDEAGTRVRVLPLRRSPRSAVAPSARLSRGRLRPPWLPMSGLERRGTGWGNQNWGAPFPG